ncbi:MAG: ABC transporter substrate-binding protein [Clostridia bacterium]
MRKNNNKSENTEEIYAGTVDVEAIKNKLKKQKLILQSVFILVFVLLGIFYFINRNNELAKQDYIGGNIIRLGNDGGSADGDTSVANPWTNPSFMNALVFKSLFLADSTFTEIMPCIGEKYELLDDDMTYVITINDDLFWSDGVPITVDDIVFSFEAFFKCTFVNSTLSATFNRIEGVSDYVDGKSSTISGITSSGNTVSFKLTAPYSNFALMLTQFTPLPKHILEDTDLSTLTEGHEFFLNTNPICSGPYIVSSVDDNNNLVLTHNPYYTGAKSDIETILMCWDYDNEVIDYYSTTDPTKMVSYRSMKGYVEYPIDVYFYRYFLFNLINTEDGSGSTAMDDVRVRQAIYHAIDIEKLASELYFGKTTLVHGGSMNLANELFEYNPEKAKELLIEAGYDFDRPFHIAYYSGDATSRILVERVASYLEDVGLTVTYARTSSSSELYEEARYDILLKNLSTLTVVDWYNEFLSTNTTITQILGDTGEFDDLIVSLTSASSSETYNEVLQQLVDLEQELLYKLPMFLLNDASYINSNRLSVPDDMTFGNTRFLSDIRFDEWYVIKE